MFNCSVMISIYPHLLPTTSDDWKSKKKLIFLSSLLHKKLNTHFELEQLIGPNKHFYDINSKLLPYLQIDRITLFTIFKQFKT